MRGKHGLEGEAGRGPDSIRSREGRTAQGPGRAGGRRSSRWPWPLECCLTSVGPCSRPTSTSLPPDGHGRLGDVESLIRNRGGDGGPDPSPTELVASTCHCRLRLGSAGHSRREGEGFGAAQAWLPSCHFLTVQLGACNLWGPPCPQPEEASNDLRLGLTFKAE